MDPPTTNSLTEFIQKARTERKDLKITKPDKKTLSSEQTSNSGADQKEDKSRQRRRVFNKNQIRNNHNIQNNRNNNFRRDSNNNNNGRNLNSNNNFNSRPGQQNNLNSSAQMGGVRQRRVKFEIYFNTKIGLY